MTGRIGARLEKVERAVCSRPLHLIVCENMAEVAEATRFLGDRFGDLIFVATGVSDGYDKATRHKQWEDQARYNAVSAPRYGPGSAFGAHGADMTASHARNPMPE
jgi:hypothetical protein